MALNTQELVNELQMRHQVGLKPNDPIFVLLSLNELLLANYLEQFKAMQEAQMEEIHKQSAAVISQAEEAGRKLINRSMIAMQDNYEAKLKEVTHVLDTHAKQQGDNLEIRLANVIRYWQESIKLQAICMGTTALIAFGVGFFCKMVFFTH